MRREKTPNFNEKIVSKSGLDLEGKVWLVGEIIGMAKISFRI